MIKTYFGSPRPVSPKESGFLISRNRVFAEKPGFCFLGGYNAIAKGKQFRE